MPGSTRRIKRRFVVTLILVLALLAAAVAGWWVSSQGAVTTVATARAARQELTVTASAPGTVQPSGAAAVSAPVAGTLATVEVTDGQRVEAGQVLARLDTAPLELAVVRAEAQVAAARAMPTGTARLNTARARAIDAAQATLRAAESDRDEAALVAPIAGTVQFAQISLLPGQPPLFRTQAGASVSPGLALFTIVDPASLRFEAQVDEVDIARVEPGSRVELALDAFPGRILAGTVESVRTASVTTATGGIAFPVLVAVEAGDARLFTGMSGDAEIATASVPDALVVPVQAVVQQGTDRFVWRVADERVARTAVAVGATTDTLAEITDGLAEGDTVATTNLPALAEGAGVRVQP